MARKPNRKRATDTGAATPVAPIPVDVPKTAGQLMAAKIKQENDDAVASLERQKEIASQGYPIQHCPGVTETKPGRIVVDHGYPEAAKWLAERRKK